MLEASELNFVKVGPGGTFKPSGQYPANSEQVDELVRYLDEHGIKRVVLHFHGGLNKESVGLAVASAMQKLYEPQMHAVTFVWETGFQETITKNLNELNNSVFFRQIVELVARYAGGKLGVEGRGISQPLTLAEVRAELTKEKPFDDMDKGVVTARQNKGEDLETLQGELEAELEEQIEPDSMLFKNFASEAPQMPLLAPELKAAGAEAGGRGLLETAGLVKAVASIVVRVVGRFRDQRDHGFYPTVIEEVLREISVAQNFGAWVWGGMKRSAESMWASNDGLTEQDRHVGTYFLDKMVELQQKRPELSIDLVGHSAGAIAICHLLNANARRATSLKVRNIVFLAPACTSELFSREVVTRPERYERFRMFAMRDDYESQDVLVPGLYTRSLLYFVSGLLETQVDMPLAGMERYLRGTAPYDSPVLMSVRSFLQMEETNRVVLSRSSIINATALEGLRCDASHHGAFDDEEVTTLSLKFMLLEEFKTKNGGENSHADQ